MLRAILLTSLMAACGGRSGSPKENTVTLCSNGVDDDSDGLIDCDDQDCWVFAICAADDAGPGNDAGTDAGPAGGLAREVPVGAFVSIPRAGGRGTVESVSVRIVAALDDANAPIPYCVTIAVNDVEVEVDVPLTGVPHGSPYPTFSNFTEWEHELPVEATALIVDGSNSITLTLGCAPLVGTSWIVLDSSSLVVRIVDGDAPIEVTNSESYTDWDGYCGGDGCHALFYVNESFTVSYEVDLSGEVSCTGDFPSFCEAECCAPDVACEGGACVCPDEYSVSCGDLCCTPGAACDAGACNGCRADHPLPCGDVCCLDGAGCDGSGCGCTRDLPVSCGATCCPADSGCDGDACGPRGS